MRIFSVSDIHGSVKCFRKLRQRRGGGGSPPPLPLTPPLAADGARFR